MAAETGLTTSRALNQLAYDIANKASDIGVVASADRILIYDVSGEVAGYTTPISLANGEGGARFVTTTATVLGLTITQHAERIVLVNTNSTVANTLTLPVATGSGAKMTVINNIAQTQGTVVIAANGTDILKGKAIALDTTAAADAMVFLTSATTDKISHNRTTTGGLGFDKTTAYDVAANTWYVEVEFVGSGSLGTPFSET